MHHAGALATSSRLHSKNRPSMPLRDHGVLEVCRPAPNHILQLVAAPGTKLLPLPSQSLQRGTGAIGDATALLDGELESLFKLGQGGHICKQSGAHWPQLRVIDLSAQATRC